MNIDYKSVSITGVIAGVLIGVMAIMGFCCYPVDAIVLLGAGALTAHWSAGKLREPNDVWINGAIAGFIGGLLGGLLYAIVSTSFIAISSWTLGSDYYETYRTICGTAPPDLLTTGVVGMVCCLPSFTVVGIILGALGALAYKTFWKKPAAVTV